MLSPADNTSSPALPPAATGSHPEFVDYYTERSATPEFLAGCQRLHQTLLALWQRIDRPRALDVADIGCGHGAMAMTWATEGHRVKALDINAPLLEVARRRAAKDGLDIRFDLGTATKLPWSDASVDVCVVPELLEHVRDWQACLDEFARVVRRPGILFLTTTNRLCPVQNEFRLPMFGWYPPSLKRHYIRLAETTRPELANYATHPAYNWFSYGDLAAELSRRGFDACWDRFDLASLRSLSPLKRAVIASLRAGSLPRWWARFAQPATTIAAIRLAV
jgi:2-polyprenyl-6-hydroxyphenyl methylase/3-demethylubiquinone-9 3-methyltransferase